MALPESFISHVKALRLFQPSDHLLIAVSGGVDSVVLCELCALGGFRFSIAHANFQLREEESDGDERFVRQLAHKYGVPMHVKLFDTASYAKSEHLSIQAAARALRYRWFDELLAAGHSFVLTAHHADDNIETVAMNFFRGTGISGLRGILPKADRRVRPLLPYRKEELVRYAIDNHLSWREDRSNESNRYTRNFFRNELLPLVREAYPEAEKNLLANIDRLRETELLYRQAIDHHLGRLLELRGKEVHIPALKLAKSAPLATIVHEIISRYGFTAGQVSDVIALLHAQQGAIVRSSSHRIIRNRNWIIIAPLAAGEAATVVLERSGDERGALSCNIVNAKDFRMPDDPFIACLDAAELEFPLIMRKWKTGDYFYPLGMQKKKKVSRLLIDKKLSATEKERVMVVQSGRRICWVVGIRIDDRFKVMPGTTKAVLLSVNPQLLM